MSYTVHGTQVWNYDDMWDILKAAGDLEVPALGPFAFGAPVADGALRTDLEHVLARLGDRHELAPLIENALRELR